MNFNEIVSLISLFIEMVSFILIGVLLYKVYIETKNKKEKIEIKNKQIPADLQKLYSTIDTKSVSEEIDNWIAGYLNDYIARNITLQGVEYIKSTDTQKMLKEVSYNIISKISDLYRWYISLLINIDNEDTMIDFINSRLSLQIIAFTSKFNQTK